MIQVARGLPLGSPLACDIAIIGAGAAGITLALELSRPGRQIILVEAGGVDFDEDIQSLCRVRSRGLELDGLTSRLRYLGGSTNHWGGRSRPLAAADLAPRAWIAESGWPIAHDELLAFLPKAIAYCEIPASLGDWDDEAAEMADTFAGSDLEPRLWQFSPPTHFGERYMADLEAAPDTLLLLEAPLVEIETLGPQVTRLHLAARDGEHLVVEPRMAVLAMGGIENARLMLASRRSDPRGVGNENDTVGRYMMGHPVYEPVHLQLAADRQLPDLLRLKPDGKRQRAEGFLHLADATQARLGTSSIDAAFYPGGQFGSPGVKALRRMWRSLRHGRGSSELADDIAIAASDVSGILDEILQRLKLRAPSGASYAVSVLLEQAPDPQSRITLADEVDALGLPLARVDWRLGDSDRRTVRRFAKLFATEVGRLGLGRCQLEPWVTDESMDFPRHGNSSHHLGTTRMSLEPTKGVVDTDCRVHGLNNLYVAGSSVFPTGGSVHPTLNLVALAVRLATHLETRLSSIVPASLSSYPTPTEEGPRPLSAVPGSG